MAVDLNGEVLVDLGLRVMSLSGINVALPDNLVAAFDAEGFGSPDAFPDAFPEAELAPFDGELLDGALVFDTEGVGFPGVVLTAEL